MAAAEPQLKIKLQIFCGDEIAMGPGKAELLDAISTHGSISGAARALGMSYRRAWLLVDTMNRCWRDPVLTTAPGAAARGGGARLTTSGLEVLERYRALQDRVLTAGATPPWRELAERLLVEPKVSQKD